MTFLEAALGYARRGIRVFPLVPNRKIPLIPKSRGGNGLLDATTDVGQIQAWWTACPDANIGIATGVGSGVAVLDLDVKPDRGPPGIDALAAL